MSKELKPSYNANYLRRLAPFTGNFALSEALLGAADKIAELEAENEKLQKIVDAFNQPVPLSEWQETKAENAKLRRSLRLAAVEYVTDALKIDSDNPEHIPMVDKTVQQWLAIHAPLLEENDE